MIKTFTTSLILCAALCCGSSANARKLQRLNLDKNPQVQALTKGSIRSAKQLDSKSKMQLLKKSPASRADEEVENPDILVTPELLQSLPYDLIEEVPQGATLTNYSRSGWCWYSFFGMLFNDNPIGWKAGIATQSDNTVYLTNICADMEVAVVKGTKVGDDIQISLPQAILYYPAEDGYPEETYWLDNVGYKITGNYPDYKINHGQAVTLKSDGKGGYTFSGEDAEGFTYTLGICGIYDETDENSQPTGKQYYGWNVVSDYDLVYTPVTATPFAVPDGLTPETCAVVLDNYDSYFAQKATTSDKLYIYTDDENDNDEPIVFEASIQGNEASFAPGNFFGEINNYYIYQGVGSSVTEYDPEYGSYLTDATLSEQPVVFEYLDGDLNPKQPSDALFLTKGNPSKGAIATSYPGLRTRTQQEYLASGVLAAPKNITMIDVFDYYGYYEVSVLMPAFTDQFLLVDPDNIFYTVYVDDDIPYEFTEDSDGPLAEPMDVIPYSFDDEWNVSLNGAEHYFYIEPENEIYRVGFQLMCKDGDKTLWESPIYYSDGTTGINTVNKPDSATPIVATEYYDLQGCRLNVDNARGLVIRRTIDANGHATAAKVIL